MKKKETLQLLLIPAALLVTLTLTRIARMPGILLSAAMPLLLILLSPRFKKAANLWVFLFVFAFGLVPNYYLMRAGLPVLKQSFMPDNTLVIVLGSILIVFALFSIEELIYGVLTRAIWKKQASL